MSGSRELVVFVIDAFPSHVYASLGLARRMRNAGYDVEYWGPPSVLQLVAKEGFGGRALPDMIGRSPAHLYHRTQALTRVPLSGLREYRARRRFRKSAPQAIESTAQSIEAAIAERKPVVALYDPFVIAYHPLFWAAGVPGVSLCMVPLPQRDPAVPPYTSSHVPDPSGRDQSAITRLWWETMARRAAAAAGSAAASRMGAYVHNDLVEALAKRTSFPLRAQRAERYMPYDLHFKDLPEWVFFGPDMELPRREPLPAGVRFVGPSVDLERHEEPIALSQGKKRIYVGMGTVEQMGSNHWFLRHIIEAFRHDTDVEVIMSCGGESARKALGETPPHIRTYAYVPQLAALDGCALAITHGGAGTYRECVVKGVPMLVYPRNHDQFGNAARVVFHGLGLAGVRTEASAAKVRAQARTIMDDVGYRDRVWLMRERVLAHEAAVDLRALVHDAAARH